MTVLLRAVAASAGRHRPRTTMQRSVLVLSRTQRAMSSTWNWGGSGGSNGNSKHLSSPEGGAVAPASIDPELQSKVLDQCSDMHASIMPLNEKLRGPLAKNSDRGTALPFVFLVGNHSSGKSSFVNYIMGRTIQTAGVAPTDDSFTVILPGPDDQDQDGPALIGDPDMGFQNLRQFGPTLIHHTQLKIRKDIRNSNFMLVDSPGMIDSPHDAWNQSGNTMDRGYDFQGVVRWFAERADVVLLFFDPDKPGTTGETLNILLHSLAGMDHKLLIVLNKADQFKKIHDFARAYGSLCWNLSKVIPRKDLPRIFTMCLPMDEDKSDEIPPGLIDLHHTRNDVVAEVMKAPKRRVDNVVTHLHDSVHQLMMHSKLLSEIRRKFRRQLWRNRLQQSTSFLTGAGFTSLALYTELPIHMTGGIVAVTVLGVGGLTWFQSLQLQEYEESLTTPEALTQVFQRQYAREVTEADEFTASIWQRVKEPLRLGLLDMGLANLPAVGTADLRKLDYILEEEIPKLRRVASPTHFGKKGNGTNTGEGNSS